MTATLDPSGIPVVHREHHGSPEIDWARLSMRSREIVVQVGFRLTAGYSYQEIADTLDDERPVLHYLELPRHVTKTWVSARWRELRREAEELQVA